MCAIAAAAHPRDGLGACATDALSRPATLRPSTLRSEPMAVTDRVKQILSWYSSDNPGT